METLNAEPLVTQSKFYTNDFNTAIIDGPLRIYFCDRQEAEALRLYFDIQDTLEESGMKLRALPLDIPNMFLMIYPNKEAFQHVFESNQDMAYDRFGDHIVMGVVSSIEFKQDGDRRRLISERIRTVFDAFTVSEASWSPSI